MPRTTGSLFFHVPLLIADAAEQEPAFEEAQKWFHYIFDPTDTSDYAVPQTILADAAVL